MEDSFMLSWIGFINADSNLVFFQRDFPQQTTTIERLQENRKKNLASLVELIEKLGEDKCRDLIGGVQYAELQRRMKE